MQKNTTLNPNDNIKKIFNAIDDLAQQYIFYPPISHQNATKRIRNAALILTINQFYNHKFPTLDSNVTTQILKNILIILNTPITPLNKLKQTITLLKKCNLSTHEFLVLEKSEKF